MQLKNTMYEAGIHGIRKIDCVSGTYNQPARGYGTYSMPYGSMGGASSGHAVMHLDIAQI